MQLYAGREEGKRLNQPQSQLWSLVRIRESHYGKYMGQQELQVWADHIMFRPDVETMTLKIQGDFKLELIHAGGAQPMPFELPWLQQQYEYMASDDAS